MKNLLMFGLLAFWGTTMAHSAEEQSAFVSCIENKVVEVFSPPESVYPMLRLQAQITEREYEKMVSTLNKSPEDLADLEVSLEQAKSPRNPEAIMMKELTRQCAKHIKWTG